MLLEGHVEILKDALLSSGTDGHFRARKASSNSWLQSIDILTSGVKYPDVPCAHRDLRFVTNENGAVSNVEVAMRDYATCNPVHLFTLLASHKGYRHDVLSEAYLSHNFLLAYLHSMTPDPRKSNEETRQNVLQLCKVMASLAVHDVLLQDEAPQPNAFWLGVLLHTVMDAFSPSHVMRACHFRKRKLDKVLRTMKAMHVLGIHDGYKPIDLSIDALITVLEDVSEDMLNSRDGNRRMLSELRGTPGIVRLVQDKLADKGLPLSMVPSNGKRTQRVIDMFKVVYMYARMRRLHPLAPSNAASINGSNSTEGNSYAGDGRVLGFLYYNTQSHSGHALKDTLTYIKRKYPGYYGHVVAVCARILADYVATVRQMKDAPLAYADTKSAFVDRTMRYLSNEVYQMHPDCGRYNSGYSHEKTAKELRG